MKWSTADLCDTHGDEVQIVEPDLMNYGGALACTGPISTVKAYEDNSKVREALEAAGNGRVLVVDAGGSYRCAMVGDQLAQLAARNGWKAIIVWGCIRDSVEIATLPVGVWALGTNPRKSTKLGTGQRDLPVTFLGVQFVPGHHLYADEDGIIVAARALM